MLYLFFGSNKPSVRPMKRGSSSREWVEHSDSDGEPKQQRPWVEDAPRSRGSGSNVDAATYLSWWDEDDGAGSGGDEDVKGPPTKAEAEAALIEFIVGNYMRERKGGQPRMCAWLRIGLLSLGTRLLLPTNTTHH